MDDVWIDRDKAHALIAAGARLIDVRTPGEFAEGALPGAVNVPVQVIGQTIQDHAAEGDTIVLYCRSGARSDVAARMLRSFGYAKAYNAGSISDL